MRWRGELYIFIFLVELFCLRVRWQLLNFNSISGMCLIQWVSVSDALLPRNIVPPKRQSVWCIDLRLCHYRSQHPLLPHAYFCTVIICPDTPSFTPMPLVSWVTVPCLLLLCFWSSSLCCVVIILLCHRPLLCLLPLRVCDRHPALLLASCFIISILFCY